VTVNVFLNCPYLTAETPVSDPHYVGNFTFFGVHEHEDGAEGEHDMKQSFVFDLTETVDRLRVLEPDLESQLTVQLMPVPLEGRDVPPQEFGIEGVEIVYI
jgi:tyrosinase